MAHDRYPKDLEEIRKRGVQVISTPESVLQAQLAAWTKVMDANKDPFFQKVYRVAEGLGEADRAYFFVNNLHASDLEKAYKHFFG